MRRATVLRIYRIEPRKDFNPRSPWGERLTRLYKNNSRFWFQSTLSVRRATQSFSNGLTSRRYFNPRSPWGERPGIVGHCGADVSISIHALREESDAKKGQSMQTSIISIHALREESDVMQTWHFNYTLNFNPRSPWGERQYLNYDINDDIYFNPRSPWGERQWVILQE